MRPLMSPPLTLVRRLWWLLLLALALPAWSAGADDLLEPEKAFRFSARLVDAHTVEVRYRIADGYYLYRDKFQFAAEPASAKLGPAAIPPGKMKDDPGFGQVETHRGELLITLPVEDAASGLTLKATSQGCADIGVCYPPLTQTAALSLAAASTPAPAASWLDKARGSAPGADAPSTPAPAPAGEGDEAGQIARLLQDASFGLVVASFFGFGLLLAGTPCVFPMIPILSGIIVGHGQHISRGRALGLSLAYVLGMAITYAAAGVAAGLSGTLLSAALQNPWVLGGFALVFVVLACSMFGFYELQLPTAWQSKLSETSSHQRGGSLAGVVAMGALSALIVGPCVAAPLAGALLYIAQTGNAWLGGAALFALALGMGAPLVVVGVAARHWLPKAGPWMEAVKKGFGVILLGVAVWLVSPVLPPALPMAAWAALLIVSAIYLHALDPLPPHARGWHRFWKGIGVIALVLGASLLVGVLSGSRDPLQPLAGLRSAAAPLEAAPRFERVASVAALEARLKSAGRPVMLDFYADWCVSCKEMERFTFSDAKVQARMSQMLLLQADVTANSEADRALLARFKLFGPPGIVFFDPAGQEIAGLRVVGYQPPEKFLLALERALTP